MMHNATERQPAPDQSARFERIQERLRPHRAPPQRDFVSDEATRREQDARIDQLREDFSRTTEESCKLFEASVSRLLSRHTIDQIARIDEIRNDFSRATEENRKLFEASISRILSKHTQDQDARIDRMRKEFYQRQEDLRSGGRRDAARLIAMTIGAFLVGAATATVIILGLHI